MTNGARICWVSKTSGSIRLGAGVKARAVEEVRVLLELELMLGAKVRVIARANSKADIQPSELLCTLYLEQATLMSHDLSIHKYNREA